MLNQLIATAAALQKDGRRDAARSLLLRMSAAEPYELNLANLAARVAREDLMPAEALEPLVRIAILAPEQAEAWQGLALSLREFRDIDGMIAAANRLLAAAPVDVGSIVDAGQTLRLAGAFDAAIAAYSRAVILAPHETSVLAGFAQSLSDRRCRARDLVWHDRALALASETPEIRINRAFRLLSGGDFASGFREFEWRWQSRQLAPERRQHPAPFWRGESLVGKRLLIEYEQGFGDAIQMLRYVPLLAQRGAEIVVEAPSALHRLLAGLAGISGVVTVREDPGPLDFRCPAMSLPLRFGTEMAAIPPAPYLRADPSAVALARVKFADLPRPLIGLVWSGDLRVAMPRAALINMRRNLTPDQLAPILTLPAGFAALQFQGAAKDLFNAAADWQDFADAAADLEAVDALVSVDTAMAHLAGALGRPTFMLARYDTDWRWLDNRSDSPWYPTMRLFGQTEPGDWDGALANLRRGLAAFIAEFRPESGTQIDELNILG